MDEEIRKEIRKLALQNAFEHEGKTQDKIVLAKILGTKPEFISKVKEIVGDIAEIVSAVNQISFEEQKKEIEESVRTQALEYAEMAKKSLSKYVGSAKTELIDLLDFVVKRSL